MQAGALVTLAVIASTMLKRLCLHFGLLGLNGGGRGRGLMVVVVVGFWGGGGAAACTSLVA